MQQVSAKFKNEQKDMKIKATKRYHFISTRMASIKKLKINVVKNLEK